MLLRTFKLSNRYVLGAISRLNRNTRLTTRIRYLDLNYDHQDKNATSIAEQVWMVSSSIMHDYKNWRFTIAADISHSTFEDNIKDETELNASFMVEYNL